jgi:hypothetical protein
MRQVIKALIGRPYVSTNHDDSYQMPLVGGPASAIMSSKREESEKGAALQLPVTVELGK